MDIPDAIRAAVKTSKPAAVIGVRKIGAPGGGLSAPGFVAVEFGGSSFDEVAFMLAALKTLYLQLVQQLAEAGGIPEQEFHNRIAAHMDEGRAERG